MQPNVRLSLIAVVLLAVAGCSGTQSAEPETTSTTEQIATTTTSTVASTTSSTLPATTTTSVASTSTTTTEATTTTTAATTTTAPPASTTTVTQVTTTTAPPAGRQLSITIAGFQFSGDTTGRVGDTVRVVNNDLVSHTWTAKNGAFDSGSLGPGQDYFYTFDQPGTYEFFCIPHPGMVGSITITG